MRRFIRGLSFVVAFLVFCAVPFSQGGALEPKHKIYHMAPEKVAAYVASTKGKRRIVVRYASWCPACRKTMPGLMDIEKIRKGSVIAISVDEQPGAFVRYINQYEDIPFPVILLRREKGENTDFLLLKALRPFGIGRNSGIPDMSLIDEYNRVVRQGFYSVEDVAGFIFDGK